MDAINRNSPSILTGFGVAGLIGTVALAIKATPKAMEILEREKDFREIEEGDTSPIDPLDAVELTWKCYIPTIAMGALTITCMIGSNHISLRRNAALLSLYSIAESTLKEYQEKVVEQIGEKKEEKLRSEIAQDHLDKNPVDNKTVIITGKGDYLCYDAFSGRYFRSNIEALQRAEIAFNQRLMRSDWLCINEFYYEIGLESIELGDEMGFIAERNKLELKFDSKLAQGEPCLHMGYSVTPHHI
jgi:hypothetical protein